MLKLFPPGSRKGNPYWIARGRIAGQRYEVSTKERDKTAAERFVARFTASVFAAGDRPGERTFAEACEAYLRWRRPAPRDEAWVLRLSEALGERAVSAITQADVVAAADALCPGQASSSRNRTVVAPLAAVLHYASSNRWCEYRRIARFREPPAVPRALTLGQARALIKAARPGPERLLVLLLFGLAQRITDTCKLDWSAIDLAKRTARVPVSKTGRTIALPIPAALEAELRRVPAERRQGAVLPYRNRWMAYQACQDVATRAKVAWTPHQARHTVGTLLARGGASLRAIMGALGHANVKSSIRYQDADIEMVREAQGATGLFGRQKRRKA